MRSVICPIGRVRRVVVGALAAVLLVGGCSNAGPSQVGAAAIVGTTGIPVERVQSRLDTVLTKEGDQTRAQLVAGRQLDDLSRQIVTLFIRHELIQLAARREHVSVTSQQVSQLLYELGGPEEASKGTIWDAEGFRQQAGDRLLAVELGRRALSSAVTFDYTTAATRSAAIQRAQQLVAAGPRAARELIDADAEAGNDATVNKRVVAGDDPIFASSPAFGVARGSVVAFQLADTQPWLIMVIRNHTDQAKPSAGAPDPGQIDPDVLEAIGLRQVARLTENTNLRLNPRYGVWDVINMAAVPSEDETVGFVAPLDTHPQV